MKNPIYFHEGLRLAAPAAFSVTVKPVGAACNMGCSYCYYLSKSELYSAPPAVMNDQMLDRFIRQFIEANDLSPVTFVWHGGEPLMAGLDFYRKVIALQIKYAGAKKIENVIQTNGLLVNEQWCRFFRDHDFLTGISLDGPEALHDRFRTDKSGKPTFARVMQAIDLFLRFGVDFNTLTTVNASNEDHGADVYEFLKSTGSRYMQFLPVVEAVDPGDTVRPRIVPPGTAGSRIADWSVSSRGYGQFLCDVFDRWISRDVGSVFVQLFDAALCQWYGVPPGVCTMSETCGEALVVEHDGNVYCCDHFVYPDRLLGNIAQQELFGLFRSSRQFRFGMDKRGSLPPECLQCRYYFACKGECPKHRFSDTGEGYKNYLCTGLRHFFAHIETDMKTMCRLIDQGKAPAQIMDIR